MRKDRAAQQRLFSGTILRGLTQPLNAYRYKYFPFLLLLYYPKLRVPKVVPIVNIGVMRKDRAAWHNKDCSAEQF
jgi:hypothetical protein